MSAGSSIGEVDRDAARNRVQQIFRYLKELHEHRSPAPRQIDQYPFVLQLNDLPQHETVEFAGIQGDSARGESAPVDAGFVLKVRRPDLTPAPAPPEPLRDWITRWDDPEREPGVKAVLETTASTGELQRIRFEEDELRAQLWEEYRSQWYLWAVRERPARRANRVFEWFFRLHSTLQREGEQLELVLGDGILGWHLDPAPIHHPLLLLRLQLEYDPSVPGFTLVETEKPTEFYATLFRSVDTISPKWLNDLNKEIESQGYHPLDGPTTSGFLRRVAGGLSAQGRFDPESTAVRPGDDPVIIRAPVLFARPRSEGFSAFIERALEQLREGGGVPPLFGNIVGIPVEEEVEPEDFEHTPRGEEPEQILFSKHANPEQVRIAEYLEYSRGVLVQGPPGTGKTHTIANLLGHLLAQGKSVLVTSHTSKALRVLRDHVVEPLRPLCVSVLDSHTRSQRELEEAVQTIVNRLGTTDKHRLETEAGEYAKERAELLDRIRKGRKDLIRARGTEYDDLVLDGQRTSPADAAREVATGVGTHDWIPSPVAEFQPLPLSVDEIGELYATNVEIPSEYEPELRDDLPELDALPTPADFGRLLDTLEDSSKSAAHDRAELWQGPPSAGNAGRLTALAESIEKVIGKLTDDVEWTLAVVAAGMRGEAETKPWEDLCDTIDAVLRRARSVQPKLFEYGPELSDEIAIEEQVDTLGEISSYLEDKGKLSKLTLLTRPRWKRLLQECRVDDREPRTKEHIDALLGLALLQRDRAALRRRWDRQMASLGAPSADTLGNEPERIAEQYAGRIVELLHWEREAWRPIEQELDEVGLRWNDLIREQPPRVEAYGDLLRIREACRSVVPLLHARAAACRSLEIEGRILEFANRLAPYGEVPVVDRLRRAIHTRDPESYETAYRHLTELWRHKTAWERRRLLLSRLRAAAPEWARRIEERTAPHNHSQPPGDPVAAWRWRQFNDELNRRAEADPDKITAELERLQKALHEVTAKLIESRTWARQHARTGLAERQALMGYRDAVKRIGRGTGRRAAIFRAEAQRLMNECRTAVPVWIMPLSRAVETFDPRTTRFDVVIIDEASQCDVMGLLAFFIADKVLVVGDDEQVSPSAVGQKVDVIHQLIEQHLDGIPNRKLYDGQMSVYDLAQSSFTRNLRLVEHFRCVPDIIEFSNQLSYQGEIKPLRDASSVELTPHVIEHVVASGYEERKKNIPEAYEIASLLAAAIEQPEYAGKTFGVISLLGDDQALLIEKIIHERLSPQVVEDREILCGNAAQFQGDERDVIFLSMVKSRPLNGGPLSMLSEGYLSSNKKRFNVAASRARDQMWVVHSLNPSTDLQPGDLRLHLIQHAQNPNGVIEATRRAQARAESEFERRVIEHLIREGYRVTPQWWVGYYRIDLVVEGPDGAKVAIECDGDRYHPREKLVEDLARQAVLERLGWRFIRIRGSEFFRDPESTMQRVYTRLASLGIEPAGQTVTEPPTSTDLIERVRRRAAEIRREWGVESGFEPNEEAESDSGAPVGPSSLGASDAVAPPTGQITLELEEDDDAGDPGPVTLQCPVCLQSDKKFLLFRGKDVCEECVELLLRDDPTVPATARDWN